MTRRTRLVHVSGPNVVPFCGVTLRRRLSVAANPHPPKGQFGKLALRKQAVGTTQYRRRAAHQGMDFEDLQEHQQIAYFCLWMSQKYAYPLSNSQEGFCWWVTGRREEPGKAQLARLMKIHDDIKRHMRICAPEAS